MKPRKVTHPSSTGAHKIILVWACLSWLLTMSLAMISPAQALNLWTRGTAVEGDDGEIVFWQTWRNANDQFLVHDITYRSDGNNVKAWILAPKTEGPHPVLLFCRGGSGNKPIGWWARYDENSDAVASLYQRDLSQFAAAGMIVVATYFRYSGKTVAEAGPGFNPSSSGSPADQSSGGQDPFQSTEYNLDPTVGDEINDAINLLPLLQKMTAAGGNGGLTLSADLNKVFMLGHSMGGARALAVLRELSDGEKFGALPKLQKVVIRGAITDFVSWYQVMAAGGTVFSYPAVPAVLNARMAGNYYWSYPADYSSPGTPGYNFYSPMASGVPIWDYSNPDSDEWPDLGSTTPPDYPTGQFYGEEIYYRSAVMWDHFWAANKVPVLILFGKGDTQVPWSSGQDLYNKITAVGDAGLYKLSLYEDSDENCPECAFLASESHSNCDHWLVQYGYGFQEIQSWLGLSE